MRIIDVVEGTEMGMTISYFLRSVIDSYLAYKVDESMSCVERNG